MAMSTCGSCAGLVPGNLPRCPHCDAVIQQSSAARVLKMAGTLIVGGAVATTLMACYGGAPVKMEAQPPSATPTTSASAALPNAPK